MYVGVLERQRALGKLVPGCASQSARPVGFKGRAGEGRQLQVGRLGRVLPVVYTELGPKIVDSEETEVIRLLKETFEAE